MKPRTILAAAITAGAAALVGGTAHLRTHHLTSFSPTSILNETLGLADSYRNLVDWDRGLTEHEQVPIEIKRKGEDFFPFFNIDPKEEAPYFQIVYKTCLTVHGDVPDGKITLDHAHLDPTKVGVFKFTQGYKVGVTLQDVTNALEANGVEVLEKNERPPVAEFGSAVIFKVRTNWGTLRSLLHKDISNLKY